MPPLIAAVATLLLHAALIAAVVAALPDAPEPPVPPEPLKVDLLKQPPPAPAVLPVPQPAAPPPAARPQPSARPEAQAAAPSPRPAARTPAPEAAPVPAPAPPAAALTPAPVPFPPQAAAPAQAPRAAAPAAPPASRSDAYVDPSYLATQTEKWYPSVSRKLGDEGRVVLKVGISKDGRAENVELKEASGNPVLDKAAVAMAKSLAFRPATANGAPVPATIELPVAFRLTN
ncbi:MAG TPA: energy transducer TonB [Noviherbaspirillum sp.]|uniref:energy transducer TonB n=1 Tax=Noviherbaspirillum sp. TaxID=1926288 RepID=UPI002D4C1B95|nr:energy transducer TonB [Noviherbaspirillum sp.]HYD94348.1 energy transducer TonB [Noviherbaspirillum sp.]